MDNVLLKKEELQRDVFEQGKKFDELNTQYEKLKVLLDQKEYARSRRKKNETTLETIRSTSSSVRYRRRQESQNVLEYTHGGKDGAIYGAWMLCSLMQAKN